MLSFAACVLFVVKEKILSSFTNNTNVLDLTLGIVWLNCLIVIPDSYKGMIRGTIKGLGLQEHLMILNLTGHWCLNLTLMILLGFYFDLGILGFWLSKLVLEIFLNIVYSILVIQANWE